MGNNKSTRRAADVVAEARTWLGTRWQHQARVKGVACDCAGLVIGVARECGIVNLGFDVNGYAHYPDGETLERHCGTYMTRLQTAQIAPGDVILMRFEGEPQHLGIAGNYVHGGLSIIHSYAVARKVVEHAIDDVWAKRIVAGYRMPGVE
jgi:NlpC/P60 family putative phage cell wall peptidase